MKEAVAEKGVKNLYHFTNIENLENIFMHGICSRKKLDQENIKSFYNDASRLDNCLSSICMSIEFPNYKMFFSLRDKNKDIKWAIIKINSRLLSDIECAFCWTNAADKSVSSIPIRRRMGKDAFLKMFEEREGYPSRKVLGIPKNYPTNPQAEVLVLDTVSVEYIDEIIFSNKIEMEILEKINKIKPDNISVKKDESKFFPRIDHKHWKST